MSIIDPNAGPPQGRQQQGVPQHQVVPQFELGFANNPQSGEVGILIKLPWEQKFNLYEVKASLFQKVAAAFAIENIEFAEKMVEQMKARREEQAAEARRASAKRYDAAGNVVEQGVEIAAKIVGTEETVEADYEIIPAE